MTEWVEGMVAVWPYKDDGAYLVEKIHVRDKHKPNEIIIDFVKLDTFKRYPGHSMGSPSDAVIFRPMTDDELAEYVKWRLIND
jgi:hypothetical protein